MELYILKSSNPGNVISTKAGGKKTSHSLFCSDDDTDCDSISIWGQDYVFRFFMQAPERSSVKMSYE